MLLLNQTCSCFVLGQKRLHCLLHLLHPFSFAQFEVLGRLGRAIQHLAYLLDPFLRFAVVLNPLGDNQTDQLCFESFGGGTDGPELLGDPLLSELVGGVSAVEFPDAAVLLPSKSDKPAAPRIFRKFFSMA